MTADPVLIYKLLRKRFGFQDWWPGDTPLEVFVGAILTQQTSWKNVERAIANIKEAGLMRFDRLSGIGLSRMERLVRPSGFYRQKAKRLRDILRCIRRDYGSLEGFMALDALELRERLLEFSGIGNETADSIVLYAAEKPTFVIDSYTKRIMHRVDPSIDEDIAYDALKGYFESRIDRDLTLYQDFHAQFVELGKRFCRKREPVCADCPLRITCSFGSARLHGHGADAATS
jgi:endonuclease-3 related protein